VVLVGYMLLIFLVFCVVFLVVYIHKKQKR
jgi:hypothetical protein